MRQEYMEELTNEEQLNELLVEFKASMDMFKKRTIGILSFALLAVLFQILLIVWLFLKWYPTPF